MMRAFRLNCRRRHSPFPVQWSTQNRDGVVRVPIVGTLKGGS